MNQLPAGPAWLYEPDENPKRKHHWPNSHAGFVEQDGEVVGKCPRGMTVEIAERLINSDQAIAWHNPRLRQDLWPDRILVVHEGVVYRATPTRMGHSYHGFPALPRDVPTGGVKRQILEIAERLGCRDEVVQWLNRR